MCLPLNHLRLPVAAADRGGRLFQGGMCPLRNPARNATPCLRNLSTFTVKSELTVPRSSVKVFSPGPRQFLQALGIPAALWLAGH